MIPFLFASLLLPASLLMTSCSLFTFPYDEAAVSVWARWEKAFMAPPSTDPDTDLKVQFTSPSGVVRTIRGFWDGDRVWYVRFMPDEPGSWSYSTSTEPPVEGLHNQSGNFVARYATVPTSPFLVHGAVRVSPNGRYLEHADGTPFFWLGDTSWNGALRSSETDWMTYLKDRKEKNFTGIQLVTTQWRAARGNAEGELAYTGFENIEINPAFFRRLDERIDAINGMGLLAAPVLLWALGKPEENPGALPESQAIKLARYIVARYGANHVIWFLAGDENYYSGNRERWTRIARSTFDDPHHAPVTLHPQGMQWYFDEYSGEDWFKLIIYQSGHGDNEETLKWIHSGPPSQKWQSETRPIINAEPPYEDHLANHSREPHSAYNVRRAVYWSLMNAPTAGSSYGAHGVWSWEIEPAEPLDHGGTGIARPWHEAITLPGSEHMKYLADLFTSIPWWTLRPEPDLLFAQPGKSDPARFVSTTRAEDGSVALLYLPTGGRIQVKRKYLDASVQATWFDPRTGATMPGTYSTFGVINAPSTEDWVLILQKAN